jgi:hypothetical protein
VFSISYAVASTRLRSTVLLNPLPRKFPDDSMTATSSPIMRRPYIFVRIRCARLLSLSLGILVLCLQPRQQLVYSPFEKGKSTLQPFRRFFRTIKVFIHRCNVAEGLGLCGCGDVWHVRWGHGWLGRWVNYVVSKRNRGLAIGPDNE